jgi:hypothetical protein
MKVCELALIFFLLATLAGCMDQCAHKKNISGPYYLVKEVQDCWCLYYDLGNAGHGRLRCIDSLEWNDKFLFAVSSSSYYFLDKTKDEGPLNDNEIVRGPFSRNSYLKLLDSLNIKDFKLHTP